MPRPYAHITGIFFLNVRVPSDLAGKVRKTRLSLPVENRLVTIRVNDKVVLSPKTKDPALARTRFVVDDRRRDTEEAGTTLMPNRSMSAVTTFFAALLLALAPSVAAYAAESSVEPTLVAALAGPQRSAKFVARDAVRHPAEELAFFGLRADMSVVEIWPGGGYWTEILAPVVRGGGRYEVALPPPGEGLALAATPIGRKMAADPAVYDQVVLGIAGKDHPEIAPADSVDLVLSFRNLHNWMADGYAPDMFAAFFKALKHGGILGIEEHRGNRIGLQDPRAADGYVNQEAVIAFARTAGFVFVDASEVNANPKDTAIWPRGVWTLPPDLALGDLDRAKYVAIGEADNAVLKFRKP